MALDVIYPNERIPAIYSFSDSFLRESKHPFLLNPFCVKSEKRFLYNHKQDLVRFPYNTNLF